MRACSGTWIAHGGGSADRDTVDSHDHVMVPPEKPAYRIRRVWLSEAEEQGYYYGFANEGLWPLCHIAHTRPTFRAERLGALRSRSTGASPTRWCRRRAPTTRSCWCRTTTSRCCRAWCASACRAPPSSPSGTSRGPTPRPSASCPGARRCWRACSAASILGFHTQFHCNNFFDTVDRFLEARVDRETFSISYGGELTEVRRYPISIEWPPSPLATLPPVAECRARVRAAPRPAAPSMQLGVGVDRLDYTKGILERFLRGRAPARARAGLGRALLLRADGGAVALARSTSTRISRRGCARSPSASTGASAGRATADRAADRAPRRRAQVYELLPRRRPVLRHQPARRHEPGGEGVRRRARRRAGRADPVASSPARRASWPRR